MRLDFNGEDIKMLREEQIEVDEGKVYSEDEALEVLEHVYAVEAMYSDLPTGDPRAARADAFARLADKIAEMIPNA